MNIFCLDGSRQEEKNTFYLALGRENNFIEYAVVPHAKKILIVPH